MKTLSAVQRTSRDSYETATPLLYKDIHIIDARQLKSMLSVTSHFNGQVKPALPGAYSTSGQNGPFGIPQAVSRSMWSSDPVVRRLSNFKLVESIILDDLPGPATLRAAMVIVSTTGVSVFPGAASVRVTGNAISRQYSHLNYDAQIQLAKAMEAVGGLSSLVQPIRACIDIPHEAVHVPKNATGSSRRRQARRKEAIETMSKIYTGWTRLESLSLHNGGTHCPAIDIAHPVPAVRFFYQRCECHSSGQHFSPLAGVKQDPILLAMERCASVILRLPSALTPTAADNAELEKRKWEIINFLARPREPHDRTDQARVIRNIIAREQWILNSKNLRIVRDGNGTPAIGMLDFTLGDKVKPCVVCDSESSCSYESA